MECIPKTNLFTPIMQVQIPSIKSMNEYEQHKKLITTEQIMILVLDEFMKTTNMQLADIMVNGYFLLSDLEQPTNTMFFMIWGNYGCIPIHIGESRKTIIGEIFTTADLIIPISQMSILYDTKYNSEPVEIKPVYTYFIKSSSKNRVKIGISTDVEERLKQLNCGSSENLEVLAILEGNQENELHQRFKKFRVKGEWFEYSSEIKSFIETLKSA